MNIITSAKLFGLKIILTIVSILLAGIPFWFYLLIRYAFEPRGFWQEFFLFGVGVYFLGVTQVALVLLLAIWLLVIWKWRTR